MTYNCLIVKSTICNKSMTLAQGENGSKNEMQTFILIIIELIVIIALVDAVVSKVHVDICWKLL